MNILSVDGLTKHYPSFTLNGVSFTLEKGKITGFIGRNGAGKSTTLNLLFNFTHPDSGSVEFFGKSINNNEDEIKQKVGFVSSGINYYPGKKLKTITGITKSFYKSWDDKAYKELLELFSLDENKTPSQLSAGMKVKYALALALSHNAELLILDEPTSGLDPLSRDDLLEVFMDLAEKGKTIFFSTHITSDLDKCADNIIYIKNGSIVVTSELNEFVSSYRVVEFTEDNNPDAALLIGKKRAKHGYTALVKETDANKAAGFVLSPATLEDIMIHCDREEASL